MTAAFRIGYQRFKVWFNPLRRKQLSVFLVCVAISFVLWILTKMSENVSSSIEYPVKIEDVPDDVTLTGLSDSVFSIRVDSRGWHLLGLRRNTNKARIPVSLKNIRLQKNGNLYFASIPTAGIEEMIAHQMEIYNNMVSLSPDTLYITFEQNISKTVPVIPDIVFTPDNQFYLYDQVSYSPSGVILHGTVSDLSSIDTVFTVPWHREKIRGKQVLSLKLISPETQYPVSMNYDSIRVTIPLEQYTEAVVTVPVHAVNAVDGKQLKLFPDVAKITYLVALKDYNNVEKSDFRVEASFIDARDEKLPLNVVYSPKKCIIRSIEPENVEYIFIK